MVHPHHAIGGLIALSIISWVAYFDAKGITKLVHWLGGVEISTNNDGKTVITIPKENGE